MTKTLALLAALAVAGVTTVYAGSSSAQLTVGVTVVRSCAVDARPSDASSSLVRLKCAVGATPGIRLADSILRPLDASGASELRVPTTPSSHESSRGLHLVTFNF